MPKVQGLEPNRPADDSWVVIGYEGIDGTRAVSPRSVKHWEDRGWQVVGHVRPPTNAAPSGVAPATDGPADSATASDAVSIEPVESGDPDYR